MALRFHELLCEWQAPRTFARVLGGMDTGYSASRIFTDPTLNRTYREVWAALHFCQAVSARKVRMTRADAKSSDFEIMQRDGRRLQLQFVEADLPGRKRGDEYRARASQPDWAEEDPYGEWVRRRALIPDALAKIISKKAQKGYRPDVALLVYLNIGTYGEWRAEIERDMIEAARRFGSSFRSVWIIWNGMLYRAWPNPSAGIRGPMFADNKVPLGRWRERYQMKKSFSELFD